MGRYDFQTVHTRRGTDSVKWDRSVIRELAGNAEALPLWVADMDFRSPPEVIEAIAERTGHGIFGYPSSEAAGRPLEAFRSWVARRYSWQLSPEEVVYSPGLIASLSLLVPLMTEPGGRVVIQTPAYRPFYHIVKRNGRTCAENPMVYDRDEHRYTLDFDHLEELVSREDTRLLIFCSPHNPAGRVWTAAELERVYAICAASGTSIISDEIHADLTYPGHTHTPFSALAPEDAPIDLITCMAPSKTFNIAGEHFSCTVIPGKKMRLAFKQELRRLSIGTPGLLAIAAADAAYRRGGPWLEELIETLTGNLELVDSFLKSRITELHLVRPEASFIAFIDCRELLPLMEAAGFSGSPASFFGAEAAVALHDGSWFGDEGAGFVRINFGTPRSLLEEALEAMAAAVERLRHKRS